MGCQVTCDILPLQGGAFMKYEWKKQEKEFYGAK